MAGWLWWSDGSEQDIKKLDPYKVGDIAEQMPSCWSIGAATCYFLGVFRIGEVT